MIVSIHVPKCAGTSFRHVLDRMFGARIWYNYGAIFCREQARADLLLQIKELRLTVAQIRVEQAAPDALAQGHRAGVQQDHALTWKR